MGRDRTKSQDFDKSNTSPKLINANMRTSKVQPTPQSDFSLNNSNNLSFDKTSQKEVNSQNNKLTKTIYKQKCESQALAKTEQPKSSILEKELLELDYSSDESNNSVISFEQVNQSHFRCFSILRPFFVLIYYLFCCCLFGVCFKSA